MITEPKMHYQEPTDKLAGVDWTKYVRASERWGNRMKVQRLGGDNIFFLLFSLVVIFLSLVLLFSINMP